MNKQHVRLSVNINKIALIRNSRGGDLPNLVRVAIDCETFGAQGITIHPRPDQRHIRYSDIPALKEVVRTELNVEGNPTEEFMREVLHYRPHQCTLVPDKPDALTSDGGWNTLANLYLLREITSRLHDAGIRVSIFIDPDAEMVGGAAMAGADRVEFYTGPYAAIYENDRMKAIEAHQVAAVRAQEVGIGVNAGHDLNLRNLRFYAENLPNLLEVSIGHALICDALYFGLSNTIGMYRRLLHFPQAAD